MNEQHFYINIKKMRNFNAWKKHIKIGGHILFHDSISVDNWAGVVKFVNELK